MLPNVVEKFKSQAGETLIETLLSVTIAMLSIGMVATAASIASSTNATADYKDDQTKAYLGQAETQQQPLVVAGKSVLAQANLSTLLSTGDGTYALGPAVASGPVTIYGNDDLYSYKIGAQSPAAEAVAAAALHQENPYEEILQGANAEGGERS